MECGSPSWCVHCTVPAETSMAGNHSPDHLYFHGIPQWVDPILPLFLLSPSLLFLSPSFFLPAECPPIPYCAQTVCATPLGSRCVRCQLALPNGLPLVLSKSGRRCRGECVLALKMNSPALPDTVSLSPPAVPIISPGPPRVGFMTGSNLLLNCSATGRPTPRISWQVQLRISQLHCSLPLSPHPPSSTMVQATSAI